MGDNLNGIFANMIQGMGFIGCAPNRVYNMAPPDGGGVEATAEGTELTLHSAAAPLTALTLYGKSEQETTTGAQLYDRNLSEDNKYQNFDISTGNFEISNNGSYWITGKIPVEPNTQYILRPSTGSGGAFYSDLETPIKNVSASGNIFTTPENANYVCFNMHRESTPYGTKLMLNKGTTALPWEPYTGGQPSPSPDYPQEIKSVGDSGTINVTLSNGGSQSQILPVQTPNGLPGIPVSSGGNYTDANGQQWMCDEIDFKREVYIKRINYFLVKADVTGVSYEDLDGGRIAISLNLNGFPVAKSGRAEVLCTRGKSAIITPENRTGFCFSSGPALYYYNNNSDINSAESFISWVSEHQMSFLYQLSTPVETPLSASELSAYAALRTYSPTTVVSNDAGAWMNVGYKATPQPMTMLARKR